MALVILIEQPEEFDEFTGEDMRRWWRYRCKKIVRSNETYFDVASPKRFNLYEGVRRLASFGVQARVARRPVD